MSRSRAMRATRLWAGFLWAVVVGLAAILLVAAALVWSLGHLTAAEFCVEFVAVGALVMWVVFYVTADK